MTRLTGLLLVVLLVCLGGCTTLTGPTEGNPLSKKELEAEMDRMRAEPVELERPIVIIDGWIMMGATGVMRDQLKDLTGADDDQFVRHSYPIIFSTLESNAARVIELVEERWPSDDAEWTVEVDAIGYSMGGLIGRVAAMPVKEGDKPRKRLRLKQLFTIATPHSGAGWWLGWLPIDQMSWATSLYGKGYRDRLDEALAEADYELICYGQGNDWVVGGNYAPPGYPAIPAGYRLIFSHVTAYGNYRHLADIAARLRGEQPLAKPVSREKPAETEEFAPETDSSAGLDVAEPLEFAGH